MMRRSAILLLAASTALHAAEGPESALSAGIALVKQGDFEGAVVKLDAAARGLQGDTMRSGSLTDAYLFLGIAYVELNQELNAKAKFREVLKVDPKRRLPETEYSQQVIRVFEAARLELYPKKKNRFLPILLIAGGGTAAAGAVVAATSGDDPTTTAPAATTTTTVPSGGGGGGGTTTTTAPPDPGVPTTTTTTTTTLAGAPTPTPTPIGPTATPGPTPAGPAATPTVVPPTPTPVPSPTPTATPQSCTYTLSPPSMQFTTLGGNGTCSVATQPGCPWTAFENADWITLTGATSGNGSGAIPYSVALLSLGTRTDRIRITQDPNADCTVVQTLLLRPDEERPAAAWESTLDVEGGRGQIVVDGQSLRYQERGRDQASLPAGPGPRQVVAQLVSARGRPGTWSFRFPAAVPGSLRPIAGDVLQVTPDQITFRLAGKPGERVVFTFETRR
jgi:hypothetical protein